MPEGMPRSRKCYSQRLCLPGYRCLVKVHWNLLQQPLIGWCINVLLSAISSMHSPCTAHGIRHRSTLTHPKAADSWRPKVCEDQRPRLPLKQYLHGVATKDVCSRCLQCKASGRSVEALNHISLQQYDDCELLWLHYRHQLSISKTAAFWALQVKLARGR